MNQLILQLILLFSFTAFPHTPEPKSEAIFRLYIFEGSDWCANCLRLERQVLATSIFEQGLVKNNIRIEKVDFPQRKKLDRYTENRNDSLASVFAFDGTFPTLIISRTDTLRFERVIYGNQSATELLDEIVIKKAHLYD